MDTGGEQDVTYSGYSIVVMYMSGVGLMVRVACFGSYGPELKSRSAVELIPGGVNSACHPSEVGKMSASMLVYYVGVATSPGLCPIAKETALAAPTLCTEYGQNLLLLLICRHVLDSSPPLISFPISDHSSHYFYLDRKKRSVKLPSHSVVKDHNC